MLSNEFISTVKSVIGTCQALGILIESKDPKEVLAEISEGKYSEEIAAKKTDVNPEKRKELDAYFAEIEAQQEAIQKEEEKEKADKEEEKAKATIESPEKEKE